MYYQSLIGCYLYCQDYLRSGRSPGEGASDILTSEDHIVHLVGVHGGGGGEGQQLLVHLVARHEPTQLVHWRQSAATNLTEIMKDKKIIQQEDNRKQNLIYLRRDNAMHSAEHSVRVSVDLVSASMKSSSSLSSTWSVLS